uniref:Uncharacterized protein n=1 Tax=Siphoviridae sp. ctBCr48 TaxID=2827802 RepID=A0A8S5SH01_9CAUD|nr:MAG TPA: hypothetical protein [Siphoviridae sp. ctBCr48]
MSLTLGEIKTAQISDELITIKSLSYVNNKYFALLAYNANYYYSDDGINWSKRTITEENAQSTVWGGIIYFSPKNCYIMMPSVQRVGQFPRGTTFLLKSSDAITWNSLTLPTSGIWSSIINNDSTIIVADQDSPTIVYSIDGSSWTKEDLSTLGITGGITSAVYDSTTSQFYLAVANVKSVPGLISIVHGTPGNWNYEAIQTSFDYVSTSPKLLVAEGSFIWYTSRAVKMKPLRADISKFTLPDAWETIEPVGVDLNTEKIVSLDYAYDNGFLCNVGTKLLDSETTIMYYPFGGYIYNYEKTDFSNQLERARFEYIINDPTRNRFMFANIGADAKGTKTVNYANIIEKITPSGKRLMNYQDIHASDIDSWKSFREKYQSGDFAGAQAIAQTLTNTQMNAQALNDLFNFIVETEQLSDPTFKSDIIQVSMTAPPDLQVGRMYFKEYT